MLGREEESSVLYNQIIKMKPSDIAVMAVTNNNIITINRVSMDYFIVYCNY